MSKHQNKNRIIDERLMQELREREWKKELLAAKNRYKCKYFVGIEIVFYILLMYVFVKSILLYYGFKTHQPSNFWIVFFRDDFNFIILRCFPVGLGSVNIVYFLFSKIGFFKYREKAERYRCPFFYYSYVEYFYERLIWMGNSIGLFAGMFLITLQFVVDYFFSLKDALYPLIIFYIGVFIMLFLLRYFLPSMEEEKELPPEIKDINDIYLLEKETKDYNDEDGIIS